jgi:ribonuclease HIII
MATVTVEKSDLDKLTEFTKNTYWLLENVDNLRAKYAGRYVAVLDSGKQLLDAQSTEELTNKIIQYGRSPETCAIEFVTRERYLLIL